MAGLRGLTVRTDVQGLRPLPELVEEIGFGSSQVWIMILASGPFLAEGMELLLVSLLTPSIAHDLRTDGPSGGFMLCLILLGALFGNIFSGPLSDLIGRQPPIIAGYALVIVFSVVSSFMNSLSSIGVLRLFVGFGFGISQPAALVLMGEVVPKSRSLRTVVATVVSVVVGALLAVLMVTIDDVWLKNISMLQWRLLLRCSSAPPLVLGFCSIFWLPESPSYLAATGDFAMSRDIVQRLAVQNGKTDVPVLFKPPESPQRPFSSGQLKQLLAGSPLNIVILSIGSMVLNFALYGCFYAVPQTLVAVSVRDVTGLAPATILILSLIIGVLVLLIGTLYQERITRKKGIVSSGLIAILSTVLFAFSKSYPQTLPLFLVLSCVGLVCAPVFCILLIVEVSMDLYPSLTSATSTSACVTCGRFGAIMAPILCDYIASWTGLTSLFFEIVVALEMMVVISFLFLDLPPHAAAASYGSLDAKDSNA